MPENSSHSSSTVAPSNSGVASSKNKASGSENAESSSAIEEFPPFYKKGFQYVYSRGFKFFAKDLNEDRIRRGLMPLGPEAAIKLWPIVLVWYFERWCPQDPRKKSQRHINQALKKGSPENLSKDLDDFWAGMDLKGMSHSDLARIWENEDFHDFTAYLDEQALKYPEQFAKDRFPLYKRPVDAMKQLQRRMRRLQFKQRPNVKVRGRDSEKRAKQVSHAMEAGGSGYVKTEDNVDEGMSGGDDVEMGGMGGTGAELTLVLRMKGTCDEN